MAGETPVLDAGAFFRKLVNSDTEELSKPPFYLTLFFITSLLVDVLSDLYLFLL